MDNRDFRRALKNAIRRVGFEVKKIPKDPSILPFDSPLRDPFATQAVLLGKSKVKLILDVGANEGQSARKYSFYFPEARIYCFEPFKASAAKLQKDLRTNPNVQLVESAVADEQGEKTLYVNEFSDMNSLFPLLESDLYSYAKGHLIQTTKINVVTIDAFIQDEELSHVNILKLDIEGGELMALQGANKALEEQMIDLLYIEVGFIPRWKGAPLFGEVFNFLSGFDYTLFNLYSLHHATNGQLRRGDALFISRRLREAYPLPSIRTGKDNYEPE